MPSKTITVKGALPEAYARGGSSERAIRDGTFGQMKTLTFADNTSIYGRAGMDHEDGCLWLWTSDRQRFSTLNAFRNYLTSSRISRISADTAGLTLTVYAGYNTIESVSENTATGEYVACLSGGNISGGDIHISG